MADFKGSSYFVMIPVEVSRNKKLLDRPKAIILFGEIYTMLNATGKFYMSNNTLCERLDCKPTAMKGYLNLLEKEGYIKRSVVYDEKTKRIMGREITLGDALGRANGQGRPNDRGRVAETTGVGSPERPGEGRSNDHKDISIRNQKKRSEEYTLSSEDDSVYREILDYLNAKTQRTGKSKFEDCPANRKLIDGILSIRNTKKDAKYYIGRQFTVDDFKQVIDTKAAEWFGTGVTFSNGTPAETYLRPSTLFSKSNFVKYVMEQPKVPVDNTPEEYKGLFDNANAVDSSHLDDLPF